MLPDWQDIENRLYEKSRAGILRFAAEHPETICSFFAYDTNPIYGEFLLSFDTPENALMVAQQNEREASTRRNQMLTLREAWRGAKYFSTHPAVTEYSTNVGLFAYHMYASIPIRELDELSASGEYPKGLQTDDDYIEGNARIVLWKVIERLIASNDFTPLSLASPFRVGYQYHDEALVVLHILNWPQM